MRLFILIALFLLSLASLANDDCSLPLSQGGRVQKIDAKAAMSMLVRAGGGQVDDSSRFITRPGVMLLSKTVIDQEELVHPKHMLVSFLVAGVSIETSMEIFAHHGVGARLTSSMTAAMDHPFFVIDGEGQDQDPQKQLLNQIQEVREKDREGQDFLTTWGATTAEARYRFNRTAPANKATALVISMPLENFHWMFIGRMKQSGNEPEVQAVVRRMIEVLHPLYPHVIRNVDEYRSFAMNQGFGEQAGAFGGFDDPTPRTKIIGAPQVRAIGVTELSQQGDDLLASLNLPRAASPNERLREFKARLTYLSFQAESSDTRAYNQRILESGHWSVTRSWNTVVRMGNLSPRMSRELSLSSLRSSLEPGGVILSGNLQQYHEFFYDILSQNDLLQGTYRVARDIHRLLSGRYPGVFRTLAQYSGSALKMAWEDPEMRRILDDKIVNGLLDFNPGLAKRFVRMLTKYIDAGQRDHDIYAQLRRLLEPYQSELRAAWARYDEGADARMAQTIADLLPAHVERLVDIGAGNGNIARALGRLLNIGSGNLFGLEIFPKSPENDPITWMMPDASTGRIPLAENSMDAAVLSMVLHHVQSPEPLLREAFRVLRPQGTLVIREHDADTFQSILYNRVIDELLDRCIDHAPGALPGSNYRGARQWGQVLTEVGFRLDQIRRDESTSLSNPGWIVAVKPDVSQ